jgi:hypothetical protein
VPRGERADVAAESLLQMCVCVRSAWGRGGRKFSCRFFALRGLAAARRNAPRWRLLQDLFGDPGTAFAARGPDPVALALARDLLQALLRRLRCGRARRVVRLRAAGLTMDEVAGRMGCSQQYISWQLRQVWRRTYLRL